MCITYGVIALLLLMVELIYFKIADKFNIIDKPNERSSHKTIVLRGGGIIFTIGLWVWSIVFGFQYPWLLAGVTLAAGISFVDDIHSLPDSLRLVVQFTAMFLVFQEIGLLHWNMWWVIPIALIAAVGGTNIFNFMDGVFRHADTDSISESWYGIRGRILLDSCYYRSVSIQLV